MPSTARQTVDWASRIGGGIPVGSKAAMGGFILRGKGPSRTVETGARGAGGAGGRGYGADLMARAELDPQYAADIAATDVQQKAEAQEASERRRLSAMGIDPSSGRALARGRNAAIALAAAKAGAANKARRQTLLENWQRMATAAGVAQRDRAQALEESRFAESQRQAELRRQPSITVGGRTQAERRAQRGVTSGVPRSGRLESAFERMGDRRPVYKGQKLVSPGTGVFRQTKQIRPDYAARARQKIGGPGFTVRGLKGRTAQGPGAAYGGALA